MLSVRSMAPFTPVGVHLSLFRPSVCVCVCSWVAGSVGGVGNERHGALSNSPPLLMAQLHHYLAHTLSPNRVREREEENRQVYQTEYEEGRRGAHHYLTSILQQEELEE